MTAMKSALAFSPLTALSRLRTEFFLGGDLKGNVADEGYQDFAVVALGALDGQFRRKGRAIGTPRRQAVAAIADDRAKAALPDLSGSADCTLCGAGARQQHVDTLAKRVGGCIAENDLGGGVEGKDPAPAVTDDHRIKRG